MRDGEGSLAYHASRITASSLTVRIRFTTNLSHSMNKPDSSQDPAFLPAMILIGVLFVLSVAGVVHSLIATFAG